MVFQLTTMVVRMTMTASSGNQFDYFGCQADLTVYNWDVALEKRLILQNYISLTYNQLAFNEQSMIHTVNVTILLD